MSTQIICDHCNQISPRHFQFTGWWTLDKTHERLEKLDTSVKSDYCPNCVNGLIPKLNTEVPRRIAYKKHLEQNPSDNPLKALRKTTQLITGVVCDSCNQDCDTSFAKLGSSWLTDEENVLTADICPACFEKLLEKPSEVNASALSDNS